MICLAVEASSPSHVAQFVFFTPNTDALILVAAHCVKLRKKTSLSMVLGTVDIESIWRALGKQKRYLSEAK